MSCISSVRYNLLLNGSLCKDFSLSRGLRWGDPLSPYLFILCIEFLTHLLEKEEIESNIQGIRICREAPIVSHILYADDNLIACRANKENSLAVRRTLDTFGLWLGHLTNPDKSHIFFSRSTSKIDKQVIKDIIGFKEIGVNSVYLRNSLIFSRKCTKEFGKFKDRIQSRLEGG